MSNASWTLTDFGAFIGTLSGLGSLAWNYVQWQKDRPNLVVNAKIGQVVGNGVISGDVLSVSLVNIGKRPINITMVAGKNSDSSFFIKPDNLPRILKEAESHIEIYPIDNLDKMISCALVELYACDANGKNWSVNAEDIAAINVKFKKYCSEGR